MYHGEMSGSSNKNLDGPKRSRDKTTPNFSQPVQDRSA